MRVLGQLQDAVEQARQGASKDSGRQEAAAMNAEAGVIRHRCWICRQASKRQAAANGGTGDRGEKETAAAQRSSTDRTARLVAASRMATYVVTV